MTIVDQEIREVRAMWALEEADRAEQKAALYREFLQNRRDTMLAGSFRPDCRCDCCVRAVLGMDPSLVCERGKEKTRWW